MRVFISLLAFCLIAVFLKIKICFQERELRALEHQLKTEVELDAMQRQQTAAEEKQKVAARQQARLNMLDELVSGLTHSAAEWRLQ